tara:strand:- start:1732 stop:2610 length:879 start_codon:yes stop_codon:yes gene_type:complete
MPDIQQDLKVVADKVNAYLKDFLQKQCSDSKLYQAMNYGLFSGGKMIRSYLIHSSCKIVDVQEKEYIPIAAAVECIHSYSLIHDDLPAMDNDDFRRGKESTHKAYGEFTAILAGSSLLTLAFEIISNLNFNISYEKKIKIIYALSSCSGHLGIAGGQFFDLSLKNENVNKDNIISMQNKKTGALMGFCIEAAAILADKKDLEEKFKRIGIKLGLLFQITDDFLDKYGSAEILGKPVQQDMAKGKNTLIEYLGEDETQKLINNLQVEIEQDLKSLPKTNFLLDCMSFIINRKN